MGRNNLRHARKEEIMKLDYYNAEHAFRFTLDTPLAVPGNREVDQIRIEIQWFDAEPIDDQPEGWWITGHLYGWPLTAKGVRDKRVTSREYISLAQYPKELKDAVDKAWTIALTRSAVVLAAAPILNPDTGLFDPAKWE